MENQAPDGKLADVKKMLKGIEVAFLAIQNFHNKLS
jgi:hypothetical protein